METVPNLIQDSLESLLKREGLHELIPNYRRSLLFPVPVAYLWLAGLWIPASYYYYFLGKKGLFLSIFIPIIIFLASFMLMVVFYVVRRYHLKKEPPRNELELIGLIFVLGIPLLIAFHMGLTLQSWAVPFDYLIISVLVMVITLYLNKQGHRLYSVIELFISLVKAFAQSLRYLLVILPLLLIIILLSVFSSDLWKIIGLAPLSRLFSIFALILFPALILYISSLGSQTRALLVSVSKRDHILRKCLKTL